MFSAAAATAAGEAAGEQDRPQRADEDGRHVGEAEIDGAIGVEHEQHAQREDGEARQQDRDVRRARHRLAPAAGRQASFVPNATGWKWLAPQPPQPPQPFQARSIGMVGHEQRAEPDVPVQHQARRARRRRGTFGPVDVEASRPAVRALRRSPRRFCALVATQTSRGTSTTSSPTPSRTCSWVLPGGKAMSRKSISSRPAPSR